MVSWSTLNTCLQFLPLSFRRLSSISITSIKSFLKSGQLLWRRAAVNHSLIVGELRNFVHLRSRRSPGVIAGSFSNFGLRVRVAFGVVFRYAERSFAKILHFEMAEDKEEGGA